MDSNKIEIEILYLSKKKKIDIKSYIEKNSFHLKNEFLKYCKNLENIKLRHKSLYKLFEIQNNHNLWEMSLIKEKSNLKSDNIYKVIIFLAIKKIMDDNKIKKIIFYNIPINENIIGPFIDNQNKKIIYEYQNTALKNKNIRSFLGNIFLVRVIYYFFILINKLFLELRGNKFKDKDSNFLILNYFAHFKSKKKGKITFNQFGNLKKLLYKKYSVDSQYIFVPSKKNLAINSITNDYSILNSNLNFYNKILIILKFIFYSFKFFFIKKFIFLKLSNFEKTFLSILSKDYDSSFSGSTFIENLIWIEVFENYLSKTKKKKCGIFLLENQAWEKAMITSWKNYNHGKIIGYTPTSVNYWHLYNFDYSSKKYASPSEVFVSSNEGYKLLKNQYQKKNIKLRKVESLWFNYLLSIKNEIKNKKDKNVLIIGDYNPKNNYKVFEIIQKSKIKKIKNIYFKQHPHDLHKYDIRNITLTNKDNKYFFRAASIIISSGSTAAILEYLFFGKKVFIYDDPYGLDLSPVKHLNYQYKFKSVKDLNKLLKVNFNKKTIVNSFKNYYFLNRELKKWKNILSI